MVGNLIEDRERDEDERLGGRVVREEREDREREEKDGKIGEQG